MLYERLLFMGKTPLIISGESPFTILYTTQLHESVYFRDGLKRNYQFLEALHMMMYCYCKLYENTFHAFY